MRRNASTVQGVHGLTDKAGRIDSGTHSDQATAAPGGPGMPFQAGSEEAFRAERETELPDGTMGGGTSDRPVSDRPASDRPASDRPSIDCGLHSVPLNYAVTVKSDSERADHERVLLITYTKTGGKSDDDLRPMIFLEDEALAAWIMGELCCLP